MSTRMPDLLTPRLRIREFRPDDLADAHRLLDVELAETNLGTEGAMTLAERRRWLEWAVLNYEMLGWLYQPPYGDRAVTLRETGELVGACGLVPALTALNVFPAFRPAGQPAHPLLSPAVGLYYALSPRVRGQGYATEAAQGLVEYAFKEMKVARVVATTTRENAASQAVMRRLGMRIDVNPGGEPEWVQVLGVIDHPVAPGVPPQR